MLGGALGLVLYNMRENNRAEEANRTLVTQLIQTRPAPRLPDPTPPPNKGGTEEARVIPPMPTKLIDGWLYIGALSFPSLDLELPVMDDWDMEALKYSPCRYAGN